MLCDRRPVKAKFKAVGSGSARCFGQRPKNFNGQQKRPRKTGGLFGAFSAIKAGDGGVPKAFPKPSLG